MAAKRTLVVQGEGPIRVVRVDDADFSRLVGLLHGKSHDNGDEWPDGANAILDRAETAAFSLLDTSGDGWGLWIGGNTEEEEQP